MLLEELNIEFGDGNYSSKYPKAYEFIEHGICFISASDFNGREFFPEQMKHISRQLHSSLTKGHLMENDVLIVVRGNGCGKVGLVPKEFINQNINAQLAFIRCDGETIDGQFLYYLLSSPEYNSKLMNMRSGSAQPQLPIHSLKKLEIDFLPGYEHQISIVGILEVLDRKIETNKKINENLLQQAGAVFNKFYDESPNQQPFTSLINVLGGGTPKTGNPDFWDGPIPFFTPKDVGAPYTFQTEKYITESGLAHCNSRLYQKDTTFVTARGTVGKVGLAGTPMAMNQSCYALASETADPLLVYFYVLKAVASLKHKASGAVFDAIVTRDFDSETINILSVNDSKLVLSIIRPIMDAIHNNSKENMRLVALRDSLLPKLMSGELDVSGLDL